MQLLDNLDWVLCWSPDNVTLYDNKYIVNMMRIFMFMGTIAYSNW